MSRTKKAKRPKPSGSTDCSTPEATGNPEEQQQKNDKKKKNKKKDHIHETKGQSKAWRYLDAWVKKHRHGESNGWRFEKCRQIWLLQNAYCQSKIPDSKFTDLLTYISSIEGKMRKTALDAAEKKLELWQQWNNLTESGMSDEKIKSDLHGSSKPSELEVRRAKMIIETLEQNK